MNFQSVFGPQINVIEDIRAGKRDIGTPVEIVVESSFRLGERARQIDTLMKADVIPVVFVDASGNVWVLTAGGSGLVMFESADGQPVDDNQSRIVDEVVAGLKKHFKIKTKKKKAEPSVVLGVVEPEYPFDWPDTIADVEDV